MAILKNTVIDDTGFIEIATGTTAQRPLSPAVGMFRFNTTENCFDYYDGEKWVLSHPEPTIVQPSYSLGLTSVLDTISGTSNNWSDRTVDISAYAGAVGRVVFEYISGGSFTGDLQLDEINLDGNTYGFETNNESFEINTANTTTYLGVDWTSLGTGQVNARWNRDSGGTPSGSTGRTDAASGSWYVYAEVTDPGFPGVTYWLRSPTVTLSDTPTLAYSEARNGAAIGTLRVYLDIIA